MSKQTAQTFSMEGQLLNTTTVVTEAEYVKLMEEMSTRFGDCYTKCSDD